MAFDYKLYAIFLFFLLLPLLSLSVTAQTSKNISLGSSLIAEEDGSFWASPFDEFEFGFQQIEEDGFLLAIWFNKIPETTVVWSANGQNLAPKGSKVELTSNGLFHLVNPNGKQIWNATNTSGNNQVAYAVMLDSGNFVLVGHDFQTLWQSFDQPTDTILPGQVLNQPARLVSRYLATDFSRGRFQFVLQGVDGNLVLYTTHFPLDDVNFPYWTTQVFGFGFSLVFNQSGYIFVQRSNGSIIKEISTPNAQSTQDFYQRAVLDYDGVFRHYIYPKNSSSNSGTRHVAWSTQSFIPSNICLRIVGKTGSGACGFNSYCSHDDDGTKICHCPAGYSFIDSGDVMKGCKQDFVSQSCDDDETSLETYDFDLNEVQNMDWEESDYEAFRNVTEDWCRHACLGDCFCAAAVFSDEECRKMKRPLSNGRLNSSFEGKALIKIRKKNSTDEKNEHYSKLIVIGSTLLGSSVFFNLLLSVVACLVAYRFGYKSSNVHQDAKLLPGMNLISFTYEELRKATNGFTEELGHGAFSTVYKGVLIDLPGNLVAVKKLKMVDESEKEFEAEVSAIGRTHHRHLVQLLGFCNEGENRLLVYEFMSKGTLASFLFDEEKRPSWYQRVEIAIGIAKGLLYLHEECNTQIIHCDIKPQNVLLDNSYTAKISDFGLAKLLKIGQSVTTTAIRGTKGYVASEWFKNMPITVKVDVYSYGVLLLELICCRRNFDLKVEDESEMVLIDWTYDCFQDRRFDLLVGDDDKEAFDDMRRVEKYVIIAIWCTQEDSSLRPSMKQVLQMLEGFIDVPNPPDPPSFSFTS